MFWMKNTNGKQDTTLTFAVVSLTIVLIKVLFGGVPFEIAGDTYMLLPIDAGTIGALLTPTLTAYVARRYTDKKFVDRNNDGIDDREEVREYRRRYRDEEREYEPLPRPMKD
jgi:hypothetical protein